MISDGCVSVSIVNMRSSLLGYVVIVIFVGVFTVYYFYDLSTLHQESRIEDIVESLRRKDVQQWTQEDIALFMASREEVYSQRRTKIRQMCLQNTVKTLLINFLTRSKESTFLFRNTFQMAPAEWL